MFDLKGPVIYGLEWLGAQIKAGMVDLITDYIGALPIMAGVSVGVYALVSMFSRGLARLGVVGVFVYGALVTISA